MHSEGVGGQHGGVQRKGDLGPRWSSELGCEGGRHSTGFHRDHCSAERWAAVFFGMASLLLGAQAYERVGLVEWEGEVLRGLGRCELASHPETESVLRITQGRGGEGKAPLKHETVEEREEQEGEKRHCFGEDGEMRPGFSLGSSAEGPGAFPIWGGLPLPYLWIL